MFYFSKYISYFVFIEGLSLLIADARRNGLIRGIQISPTLALSHLLFVDDVILMGSGTLQEWAAFEILDTFSKVSGMLISMEKSAFMLNNIPSSDLLSLTKSIPYKKIPISSGFNYLGFYIKPLGYRTRDSEWLIKKFEKKISLWTHKMLSLGGRLILV